MTVPSVTPAIPVSGLGASRPVLPEAGFGGVSASTDVAAPAAHIPEPRVAADRPAPGGAADTPPTPPENETRPGVWTDVAGTGH